MKSFKEQALEMLQRCEVVVLASITKEGYPRPVPMSKVHAENFNEIWMATGKNSLKTKDFSINPKAGLCFYEAGNSIAMSGTVEIITEQTIKEKLWQDWFIKHFPKGATDDNYILLKFIGCQATIWIDGKFSHRKI